jgi:hypothetical protein
MSNTFQVGKQYKFNKTIQLFMKAAMQIQYVGEEGVFTVHQVDPDGSVWTDDCTSPITTDRCKIPADIIEQCEEVSHAGRAIN